MTWRHITDIAKKNPFALRLADRLGRGRGRLRFLDRCAQPPPPPPFIPDLSDWEERPLSAIWIGHATVLLRIAGMTLLTDPVFSTRVGIGCGLFTAGPRRLVSPALTIRQLPRLDLILISHAHFDHLDRPTLDQLPKTTPLITAPNTSDLIRDLGYTHITELPWDATTGLGDLAVTARPVRHWGARVFFDQHRGYNAYELTSPNHRVLFAGDTAYHDLYKSLDPVDLAILGIGAYDPYIAAHTTPEQAWTMFHHLRARYLLPMHHATFQLSHESPQEPLQRLLRAASTHSDHLALTQIGQSWTAP